MNCCCTWGDARGGLKGGEWPEGECKDCPIHRQGLGPVDHRCRRHQAEAVSSGAWTSELNARSDALIDDLVALERELA